MTTWTPDELGEWYTRFADDVDTVHEWMAYDRNERLVELDQEIGATLDVIDRAPNSVFVREAARERLEALTREARSLAGGSTSAPWLY